MVRLTAPNGAMVEACDGAAETLLRAGFQPVPAGEPEQKPEPKKKTKSKSKE